MWIGIVSIFPEMFQALTSQGVVARALGRQGLALALYNPRDYADDRHATVDDRPYGGGPGMVMKPEPWLRCLNAARQQAPARHLVINLSPQGQPLTQPLVEELALAGQDSDRPQGLILLAGRYEGIDERLLEMSVDLELSIGDYVLTGGELAAMVLVDAVARYVPGTLGNAASTEAESHVAGLLDCPHYTRPEVFEGQSVPAPLLSGDHAAIARWRLKQSLGRTYDRRPDMLAERWLSTEERALLQEYLTERGGVDADL